LIQVNGVKFSPDAKRVVSCGSDFYMKVIDLKTGSILFSKGPIIAFSLINQDVCIGKNCIVFNAL
jgi:WD40 repeat protein